MGSFRDILTWKQQFDRIDHGVYIAIFRADRTSAVPVKYCEDTAILTEKFDRLKYDPGRNGNTIPLWVWPIHNLFGFDSK